MRSLVLEHVRRDENDTRTLMTGILLRSGLLAATILVIVVLTAMLMLSE